MEYTNYWVLRRLYTQNGCRLELKVKSNHLQWTTESKTGCVHGYLHKSFIGIFFIFSPAGYNYHCNLTRLSLDMYMICLHSMNWRPLNPLVPFIFFLSFLFSFGLFFFLFFLLKSAKISSLQHLIDTGWQARSYNFKWSVISANCWGGLCSVWWFCLPAYPH